MVKFSLSSEILSTTESNLAVKTEHKGRLLSVQKGELGYYDNAVLWSPRLQMKLH